MIKLYTCRLVLFIGNLIVGHSVDIIKFVKYDVRKDETADYEAKWMVIVV